jgi:HMG (high mobility group) box
VYEELALREKQHYLRALAEIGLTSQQAYAARRYYAKAAREERSAEKQLRREQQKKARKATSLQVTSFVLYANETRKLLRQKHPDMSYTEIGSMLGLQWGALTPEERQVGVFADW